ncbi:MAG: ankyrin repeat domain-containing protein [Bacteroidota bacterium]
MLLRTFLHRSLLLLAIFSLNPSAMQTRAASEEEEKKREIDALSDASIDEASEEKKKTIWLQQCVNAIRNQNLREFKRLLKEVTKEYLTFEDKNKRNFTLLHCAAYVGYVPFLRFLIERGYYDKNFQNTQGETALYVTVIKQRVQAMKYLVEEVKADINIEDNDHLPPYYYAFCDNPKESKLFLDYFIDIARVPLHKRNSLGMTLLHMAMQRGNLFETTYILTKGKFDRSLLAIEDSEGMRPLDHAVSLGHTPIIDYCFVHWRDLFKLDVDACNSKGMPMISYAIRNEQPETTWYLKMVLWARQIDLYTKTARQGKLALLKVLINPFIEGARRKVLESLPQPVENEVQAEELKHSPLIQTYSTSLDAKDSQGNTILHSAILGNKPKVVDWLIQAHKDTEVPLNIENDDCYPPIHLACRLGLTGSEGIIDKLSDEVGLIDFSSKNSKGLTPMHAALLNENSNTCLNTLIYLIEHMILDTEIKYCMNIKEENRLNVSYYAAYKGRSRCFIYLFDHLKEISCLRNLVSQTTFLQGSLYAAIEGHQLATVIVILEMIENLLLNFKKHKENIPEWLYTSEKLKKNAHILDMIEPDSPYGKWTPFQYAVGFYAKNIIDYFVEQGVSVNQRNSEGKTAFHVLASHSKNCNRKKLKQRIKMWYYLKNELHGDPMIKDNAGHDALDDASENFRAEFAIYDPSNDGTSNTSMVEIIL